jgi:copper(I)-binding protein
MFSKTPRHLASSLAAALLAISGSAFAHDFKVGELKIDHPYAHPTGPGMKNGAAYLQSINNQGKVADQLVSASSPVAARVELHRMEMQGDIMRMRELPAIDLPAGRSVAMGRGTPEGYHLMLMDLKQPLKEGERFPIKLRFKNAGETEVTVVVQQPKAAGHGAHSDKGHKH